MQPSRSWTDLWRVALLLGFGCSAALLAQTTTGRTPLAIPPRADTSWLAASPDGRFVAFDDTLRPQSGGTGNVAMWDLRTGAIEVVTKFSNVEQPWAEGSAEAVAWSRDGQRLAYAWIEPDRTYELRVVDRNTGRHRIVFVPGKSTVVRPYAWSPDGQQVLTSVAIQAGEGTIGACQFNLIAVADGSVKALRKFDGSAPSNAAFSSDGRFIAYDFQPRNDSTSRDVVVMAVDGSHETPIANDPAGHEALLSWLPNGHLLFSSARNGRVDVWAIQVAAGRPVGSAVVVVPDVEVLTPLGTTSDGRVFVRQERSVRDVLVAELDPATGRVVRPPPSLAGGRSGLQRRQPAWSPDGARIAYVQSAPGVADSVVVQTFATGEIRDYEVPVKCGSGIACFRWGNSPLPRNRDVRRVRPCRGLRSRHGFIPHRAAQIVRIGREGVRLC